MKEAGRMVKIDFPEGLEWVNCLPLSTGRELAGKVVVLDFWTSCCINCMHVLPDLAWIEEKYANRGVVVVGVHSPKFAHERDVKAVRDAVGRYGISHPVVNDPKMVMWESLGICAWPSLVVLGPGGEVLQGFSGEGNRDRLDEFLWKTLRQYGEAIDPTPIKVDQVASTSLLSYPGKIECVGDKLFVADSGHNQIAVVTTGGEIVETIGSGIVGHVDGSFDQACFYRPQGMAYADGQLFVADTENHAIRLVDMETRQVTTLARDLNSPWDVALHGKQLFIAMAGNHQIWVYDGQARLYSGNGYEMLHDHYDLLHASWAQPSGLAIGDGMLYIADSESSAIRRIDLTRKISTTVAGGDRHNPRNLFCFGDRDGVGEGTLLQHPLGLAWHQQQHKLIIADSYNHKLKVYDPKTGRITSLTEPIFSEPGGIAISADGRTIYVADTNAHSITTVNLATGTLKLLLI